MRRATPVDMDAAEEGCGASCPEPTGPLLREGADVSREATCPASCQRTSFRAPNAWRSCGGLRHSLPASVIPAKAGTQGSRQRRIAAVFFLGPSPLGPLRFTTMRRLAGVLPCPPRIACGHKTNDGADLRAKRGGMWTHRAVLSGTFIRQGRQAWFCGIRAR